MAEGGQLSFGSFKEHFDDQLTCSVCLDQYTNPKTLPCLHSFCLHCIEQLPVDTKDGKYYISCPTCRVDHLLPQGGAAESLPNAFQINSLLDLRTKLVAIENATTAQLICPQHNDLLTVYCETCCQVICRDCTISIKHNEHTFCLVSECYPKHHEQILGNLDLVKHKLADMSTAMTHLDTREREVVEQGENVKKQINTHAQQLIDNIQRSRTHLTQQVDTIIQQKTQTLLTQKQQAQKLHTQLKTCQDMIEHSLKEWNQQQILTQKNTMMDEMNTATEHVEPVMFQPIEDANIQFSKAKKRMGSIAGIAFGSATVEVSQCATEQPSTATLTLYSQEGSPFSLPAPSLISSTLSSPGNRHSVKCPITQPQPGKYNITFTPSSENNQLIVQVGGVDVPDSPFTLPIVVTREPVNIINALNKPWGIAVLDHDNGDIIVAESGAHCVTILNNKGERLRTLAGTNEEQFCCPCGVAVSNDGHILVTDCHRLQKLTTDGVLVKSVGSKKSGRGQQYFYFPKDIAVHRTTGQIFVADSYNYRIQVFDNDLTFSHTISPSWSILSPQFECPLGIAIDNEGYLYIVDNRNRYILKVSGNPKGKYTKAFGSIPDQKVIHPSSITVHNNLVYVGEYNENRLIVFDTYGKFQYCLEGHDITLKNPPRMSTDVLGNLYISDSGNNRIVVI